MGSMSLSSSTSKDGQSHILPHMGFGPGHQDSSLVNSQGPDATFGMNQGMETTANTVTVLEESKDEQPKAPIVVKHQKVKRQKILNIYCTLGN